MKNRKVILLTCGLILSVISLTGCSLNKSTTTSTSESSNLSTSTNQSLGGGLPAEAKAIIDKIMAAKQSGDSATADALQAELDAKFPNLPKPGSGRGENGGAMPSGGTSTLDTSSITKKYLNIAYSADSATQKLDIYVPEGTGPFPVIIAIHGGAFMMGSKDSGDMSSMIKAVNKGYAVVSVDYRLSGEAKFPAAINDVQSAIKFVKDNAAQYNLNPNKVATWGGSAGGNLAALAGTKGEVANNTNVQAVVDWFGPIYFSTMDQEFASLGAAPAMGSTNTATSPETKYLGQTVGSTEAEALVKQASPQTYISVNSPAFLIQHGTADRNIPITQSENFASKLKLVIGADKVTFEKIEGAGHGGTQFDSQENLDKVFTFLDKYLK